MEIVLFQVDLPARPAEPVDGSVMVPFPSSYWLKGGGGETHMTMSRWHSGIICDCNFVNLPIKALPIKSLVIVMRVWCLL